MKIKVEPTFVKTHYTNINHQMTAEAKIESILELVEMVFNSNELGDFILYHGYYVKPWFRKRRWVQGFKQTKNTNYWHWTNFMGGGERNSHEDNIWQVRLNIYYRKDNVKGFTNPPSPFINSNSYYFDILNMYNYDITAITEFVENLTHEYCHLVGMHHSFWWKKWQWNDTAPYAIGRKAAEIAEAFIMTNEWELREW